MFFDYTQTAMVGGVIVFPDYAQFTQPLSPDQILDTSQIVASPSTSITLTGTADP